VTPAELPAAVGAAARRERLRIAVIAPVWFPVPPPRYGGIEAVVAVLADGLVAVGHEVTLFASGDSRSRARLAAAFAVAQSERIGNAQVELRHALACFERADEFDVISDHSGPPAAVIGGAVATPVVHTVHGPLDGEPGELYEQVARVAPTTALVSLSLRQRQPRPGLPWIANVPNAIDPALYPFSAHGGEHLLFLGRMTPEKGAHHAIEAARRVGLPLLLAGKMREAHERAYFREQVEPLLGDGTAYVGEVDHAAKVELLGTARATLVPVDWEEPFGLVSIESMACGTPVVATRRGALPEVVEPGRSGFLVDDASDMADVLPAAERLDRREVRRAFEERFTPARMVAGYLDAFARARFRGGRRRAGERR
jgi:glycosyltransferase involved in cell wall biosynthesis